jgi:hypothetical protein
VGWVPEGFLYFYTPEHITLLADPFDIVTGIDVKVFNFFLIGESITYNFSKRKDDLFGFWPSGVTSVTKIGISPIEGISLIYEHSCGHPVIPFFTNHNDKANLDFGYDRIYFELKGRIVY